MPLFAGEILFQNQGRLGALRPRNMPLMFALIASFGHVAAWWLNARRYATGTTGPLLFIEHSEWAPPFGWWPWLLMTLIAVLAMLMFALYARSSNHLCHCREVSAMRRPRFSAPGREG